MISVSMRLVVAVFVALAPLNVVGCGGPDSPEPVPGTTLGAVTPTVSDGPMAQSSSEPVTGKWAFTIVSDLGTGAPTVTFEQVGESLTGHYSSSLYGEASLTGTLKGKVITFTVAAQWQGASEDLNFTGEYDGSKAIEGTYFTSAGDGKFTAIRKQ